MDGIIWYFRLWGDKIEQWNESTGHISHPKWSASAQYLPKCYTFHGAPYSPLSFLIIVCISFFLLFQKSWEKKNVRMNILPYWNMDGVSAVSYLSWKKKTTTVFYFILFIIIISSLVLLVSSMRQRVCVYTVFPTPSKFFFL